MYVVAVCMSVFHSFTHPEPGDSLAVDGQDDVARLHHGKGGGAGHAAPNFQNLRVCAFVLCFCVCACVRA